MGINTLNQQNIQIGFQGPKELFNIEILKEVSSTNDIAKKCLKKYPDKFTLVATNKQTAGKGRNGKSFYSDLDHGLYFTLALQPNENKIENIPLYTVLAAAALVEVLEEYVEEAPAIKWVNDVFYQGRKISGILSELVSNIDSKEVPGIVIGIGLNIAGDFSQSEEDVQSVAGTLFGNHTPQTFDQNEFLSEFLNKFYSYHKKFQKKTFMAAYESHLLGIGKEVYYSVKGKKQSGVIQGINEQGHLLVMKSDQTLETLYGQEVHFGSAQFTK